MNLYVVKTDENGNVIWDKNFGADESEECKALIECKDGSFLAVGYSDSYANSSGMKDIWILKLDKNGIKQWDRVFVTNDGIDEASAVIETEDGGFIVVGNTIPILPNSNTDIIALKVSASGQEVWKKIYKEQGNEEANGVIRTENGFFIIGRTDQYKSKKWDVLLKSIDKNGEKIWNRNFGGGDDEMGNAIIQTKDGGFAIAGYSYSYAQTGSHDAWILKIDKSGMHQWDRVFGGGSTDEAFSIVETAESGIVMTGYTDVYEPNENNQNISKEGNNILLIKLSAQGDVIWENFFGGLGNQRAYSIAITKDGSLVLAGYQEDESHNTDALLLKVNKGGYLKE
jgi:hypothetical protein